MARKPAWHSAVCSWNDCAACASGVAVLFDIKLFCVLGGLMGPYHILWCMWYAVLAGAVLSLAILFFCGGFHQRFHYLEQYVRQLIETGKQSPYYRTGTAFENIHFTIPIFMSVMLYTGGIY